MNHLAVFIIPYFGNLPNYFRFWLRSCGNNPNFTWLLITDAEINEDIPLNVIVKKISFADLKRRIQGCFDFEISLDKPYKLCDFKPAYGFIFQQDISDYVYWGVCDMDLIWGNLASLASIVAEKKFQKILDLGHCMLLKNNPEINRIFQKRSLGCLYYRDVFASSRNMIFDEDGAELKGFSSICKNAGLSIYTSQDSFADIKIRCFHLSKILSGGKENKRYHEMYLKDEQGITELYEDVTGNICREQQLYVHFQKRSISIETGNVNHFLLIPPGRIIDAPDGEEYNLAVLAPENLSSRLWNVKMYLKRLPKLLRMKICHAGRIIFLLFRVPKIFANRRQ